MALRTAEALEVVEAVVAAEEAVQVDLMAIMNLMGFEAPADYEPSLIVAS